MVPPLLRVFWPADFPKSTAAGTIIGWQNSSLDFFVVSVLYDVQVREVAAREEALSIVLARRDCVAAKHLVQRQSEAYRRALRTLWCDRRQGTRSGQFPGNGVFPRPAGCRPAAFRPFASDTVHGPSRNHYSSGVVPSSMAASNAVSFLVANFAHLK